MGETRFLRNKTLHRRKRLGRHGCDLRDVSQMEALSLQPVAHFHIHIPLRGQRIEPPRVDKLLSSRDENPALNVPKDPIRVCRCEALPAEPLEIGVVTDDDGTAVIHAMTAREKFLKEWWAK